MSSSSSRTDQDQSGDVFNAPLIGNSAGVYRQDNTLLYVVGGVAALFVILQIMRRK